MRTDTTYSSWNLGGRCTEAKNKKNVSSGQWACSDVLHFLYLHVKKKDAPTPPPTPYNRKHATCNMQNTPLLLFCRTGVALWSTLMVFFLGGAEGKGRRERTGLEGSAGSWQTCQRRHHPQPQSKTFGLLSFFFVIAWI
jgi:hypothetical protein